MRAWWRILLCLALIVCVQAASAQPRIVSDLPPGLHVPAAAQPGPDFDVDRATQAWLALLSPEQRARSDAYFEGQYWMRLWSTLYTVAVMWLLLRSGASRRMRDAAERITRRPFLSTFIFGGLFVLAVHVLGLPWALYAEFYREHQYGLSNLTLGGWLREAAIGLAVNMLLGALVIAVAYAGVRRSAGRWWVWATGLTFVFTLFLAVIYPPLIAPLFNTYKPLPEGPERDAVLQLARANEIPTEHLEWFDASRQTTRVSANVSGIGPIARINLNDNLLQKTSLPEIKAVLGHEMGHYVLNHGYLLAVYLSLVAGLSFALVEWILRRLMARWEARLPLRGRADPAGLPLVLAILSVVSLLLMPLFNTVIRTVEMEADAFGLNAAREPQGFAMVSMRLSTYRKLQPGPVEEFVFYDHPSGYDRVRRAMVWQKENLREIPR